MAHALIVEDDADAARRAAQLLTGQGYTAACAGTLLDARRQLALQSPDLVLLDLQLPDGNGLALLDEPELLGQPALLLMTDPPPLPSALRGARAGRLHCLVKPFTGEQLRQALAQPGGAPGTPGTSGTSQAPGAPGPPGAGGPGAGGPGPPALADRLGLLVGASAPMQAVYRQITRVAPTGFTVFITGETGTGKELVARTLHELGPRRHRPFVAVNCGALSPQLAESELFGHERGSFTGAERQHPGFFEQAGGGTLLLDEITEMPLPLQVKLLRVLESGSFTRVGATGSQAVDVRVVAASNREPAQAVAEGLMREDLFWRLDVFPIALPPLRQRLEDIPLLAAHLLAQIGQREGQQRTLDAVGLARLAAHDWPGNVRELRNVLKRAWVMGEGPRLEAAQLSTGLRRLPLPARGLPLAGEALQLPLGISLADAERRLIEATLAHHGQHREQAAATLGISLKTLYNRLRGYGAA